MQPNGTSVYVEQSLQSDVTHGKPARVPKIEAHYNATASLSSSCHSPIELS
jgi:hypothetical protein